MAERPDYTAASLTPLTMREAVARRPGMYFGSYPPADWPLVIVAWTVQDLLDLAPESAPHVEVMVCSDGRFKASVRHASVFCPARARTAADAVKLRQWWTQLCRDVTISVTRQGHTVDPLSVPAGEHGHRSLVEVDITVRAGVDPEVVSISPAMWWTDWLGRLPDALHRLGFEFGPGQQIVAVDEASNTRNVLSA